MTPLANVKESHQRLKTLLHRTRRLLACFFFFVNLHRKKTTILKEEKRSSENNGIGSKITNHNYKEEHYYSDETYRIASHRLPTVSTSPFLSFVLKELHLCDFSVHFFSFSKTFGLASSFWTLCFAVGVAKWETADRKRRNEMKI